MKISFSTCCLIFIAVLNTVAQQAPYLISVEKGARIDEAVLTWRNNCAECNVVVVFRKQPEETDFRAHDTLSSHISKYADIDLLPGRTFYGLKALSDGSLSPFSNALSIDIPFIFSAPGGEANWNRTTQQLIIYIRDSSNIETGYRVLRLNESDNYDTLTELRSAIPQQFRDTAWIDTAIEKGRSYTYRILAFNDSISKISSIIKVDIPPQEYEMVLKEKLSEFPVAYSNWCMAVGDSILLDECASGDSSYTIINVSDPRNPFFAGIRKDAAGYKKYRRASTFGNAIAWCENQVPFSNSAHLYFALYSNGNFTVPAKMEGSCGSNPCTALRPYFKNDSVLQLSTYINDYCGKPPTPCSGPDLTFSIDTFDISSFPIRLDSSNNFLSPPTNLLKRPRCLFADTLDAIAYIVYDSLLTVFSYSKRMASSAKKSDYGTITESFDINCIYVPRTNNIVITLPRNTPEARVTIFDISGKTIYKTSVYRQKTIAWKCQGASSAYYIHVHTGKVQLVKSFAVIK